MDWRSILFGWPARAKPAADHAADALSAGNGGDAVHGHVPEGELRSSQQHKWLFDDGVLRWNQHRHDKDFKPNFAGLNFPKEAAKTRLWGRPADIIGEERVVLTGIDLSYADMQGCTLTKADLRHAKLVGADLRNSNLAGALLNNADLTDCDLRGATLDGAQFARAKLAHANMSGAGMKGANFAWADLSHAVVGARNLREANVFGAIRDTIRAVERPPATASAEIRTA
jgi:uncharacterized protein YjbI with pentapeptide repeats